MRRDAHLTLAKVVSNRLGLPIPPRSGLLPSIGVVVGGYPRMLAFAAALLHTGGYCPDRIQRP